VILTPVIAHARKQIVSLRDFGCVVEVAWQSYPCTSRANIDLLDHREYIDTAVIKWWKSDEQASRSGLLPLTVGVRCDFLVVLEEWRSGGGGARPCRLGLAPPLCLPYPTPWRNRCPTSRL